MAKLNFMQTQAAELRLGRIDGGVSYKYVESQLNNNQSPYMQNMNADDRGSLIKRFGQKIAFDFGSDEPINSMAFYKGKIIVHKGNGLYEIDPSEI